MREESKPFLEHGALANRAMPHAHIMLRDARGLHESLQVLVGLHEDAAFRVT